MNAPLGHGPVPALVALLCAYTLGGIPTGLWLGRLVAGVDVRTIGSHRTGATNVQRALGTSAGLAVFAVDVGKGFLAVLLARWLAGEAPPVRLLPPGGSPRRLW